MSNTKKHLSRAAFVAAFVILIFVFSNLLTGCLAKSVDTDVTGHWVYSEDGVTFTGTVSDDGMTMYVDFDGSQGLYWVGTFPKTIDDGATVTSDANVDALATSLYGSLDETKEFTYTDGKLSFEFSMMGTTKTVEMHR